MSHIVDESGIDQVMRDTGDLLGISREELRGLLRLLCKAHRENIAGAVVELGCAQGITTTYFRKMLVRLGSPKELHVFDSFEGLPAKRVEDGNSPEFFQGVFAMGPSVLEHNFDKRGLVRPFIHKGWFGHISDYPDPIAFAFLDGDFYDSIMDGLRALWPRLSPGAFLAVHDVYHPGLPGVLRALDDFRVGNDFTLEQTHADGIHYLRKGGQPVIHTP